MDAPTRRWRLSLRSALVVALVLVVLAAVVVLRGWTSSSAVVVPLDAAPVADPFASGSTNVVVHVVGEVRDPGVVELGPGARVSEAVEAAGGATTDAELGSVNLARVVADDEQIVVPSRSLSESSGAGAPDTASSSPALSDPRLDLNSADAAALESLPGIGPVLAERILTWRAEHGRFSSVDELAEVSGIGPRLLGGLRDLVRVG